MMLKPAAPVAPDVRRATPALQQRTPVPIPGPRHQSGSLPHFTVWNNAPPLLEFGEFAQELLGVFGLLTRAEYGTICI